MKVLADGGFRAYQGNHPNVKDSGGLATGSCQWVEVRTDKADDIIIVNLHGLWQRKTEKTDTPERLTQSKILQNFFNLRSGKKILCGDFNLRPDGESIKILEENMINLVKKSGITSTRSSFYKKPERFADYILTSPDVKVKNFEVLQDEVSDHLPLFLEFE